MKKIFTIEKDKNGFTVWCDEIEEHPRWVIDGSTFLIDGEITINKKCFKKRGSQNRFTSYRLKKRFTK